MSYHSEGGWDKGIPGEEKTEGVLVSRGHHSVARWGDLDQRALKGSVFYGYRICLIHG